MKDFLHHFLIPRESNNYRAKILHHKSIFCLILLLFISQFLISTTKSNFSNVLGITTDISSQELLLLTNQKRQENGLQPLTLNEQLSQAAALKGNDMFGKNYWSHNSPDGITPWFFIKRAGYNYVYAGENLARGFTSSTTVVEAWMASPSHKENVLSKNYKEIGFAVLKGKLLGEETTLVVEMFGNSSQSIAVNPENNMISTASSGYNLNIAGSKSQLANTFVNFKPLIDSKDFSLNISMLLLLVFIFILILDMIIAERRKIVRLVGHNIDHIFFLISILLVLVIFAKGIIL